MSKLVLIEAKTHKVYVNPDNVIFIESLQGNTIIHFIGGREIQTSLSLSQVASLLSQQ